jgi:Fe-S oxidoreductase
MFEPFAEVPAYPLVFPVFWGAFLVFALIVARHLRVFAAVRADGPSALAEVPRRAWGVVRYTVLQVRMFRDRRAGVMHYTLFLGSTLLLIGNINIVTGGLLQAVVAWPFDGLLWAVALGVQNVVALGVFVAAAYAIVRRVRRRPARLHTSRTSYVILAFILAVVATEFLAQAFEVARYGEIRGAIVADALAGPLGTIGADASEAAFVGLWWGHVIVLSAFLIYIPTNKHFHVYTAFVNVYLRKLAPRGELPAMDLEREDAVFGLRTLQDLGWKDLLDGFTCTECGRCTEQCPANRTGKALDPRALIMGIRRMSEMAEQGVDLVPNSPLVRETHGLAGLNPSPAFLGRPIVDDAIPYDAVWDCVTCGACVEACPVLIEHVDKIVGLRRNLVLEDSRFPQEVTGAFRNMESVGNPWGQPPGGRTDWTKGLPFPVRTVAEVAAAGELQSLEVLYWVGCAAAFDDRNRKVARAVATCLDAAGVWFAILGQEESCTGDPARRMGNDYVYQILAAGNIETLDRYRMGERTIVTACPHCFTSLGTEYRQLGGRYRVVHHSAYLAGLLRSGRLVLGADGLPARSVTYHDSCYLARYNGILAAPRDVIGAIPGLELREMDARGRQTFCCGAGGGRMWMEESRGTRINAERTRQAIETGADTVATACPFCMTMLRDGLAEAGRGPDGERPVSSQDISELLAAAVIVPREVPPGRELPIVH